MGEYEVTEGIEGVWYYHLSKRGRTLLSLCDKLVMPTSLPLSMWGTVTHLKERYCEKCKKIREERDAKDQN